MLLMPAIRPTRVSRVTTGTAMATKSAITSVVTGFDPTAGLTLGRAHEHARGETPGDDRKRDRQTDENAKDQPRVHDRIVVSPVRPR